MLHGGALLTAGRQALRVWCFTLPDVPSCVAQPVAGRGLWNHQCNGSGCSVNGQSLQCPALPTCLAAQLPDVAQCKDYDHDPGCVLPATLPSTTTPLTSPRSYTFHVRMLARTKPEMPRVVSSMPHRRSTIVKALPFNQPECESRLRFSSCTRATRSHPEEEGPSSPSRAAPARSWRARALTRAAPALPSTTRRPSLGNLGSEFPNLAVQTQEGDFKVWEYQGASWLVVFSHPKDYTPGALARRVAGGSRLAGCATWRVRVSAWALFARAREPTIAARTPRMRTPHLVPSAARR